MSKVKHLTGRPRISSDEDTVKVGTNIPRSWRDALKVLAGRENRPYAELLRHRIKCILHDEGVLPDEQ